MEAPTLSVVVCTRERERELAACLAVLRRQGPEQIVVVDNAPALGGVRRLLSRRFPAVDYVAEPRIGVQHARNRGLAAAAGEVVAFVDDDCRPHPQWLATVRASFRHDPDLGACTGPVLPLALESPAQRLLERRGGYSKGNQACRYTHDSHCHAFRHYPVQAWMFGTGANMAFRRRVLQGLGGFDPNLPRGEDLDVLFRVVSGGFPLRYEPAAAVYHRHPHGYAQLRRSLYGWGWAYTAWLAKVVRTEPRFRRLALAEWRGFLRWQLARCRGAHEGLPLDLRLAELAGALAGAPAWWWRYGRLPKSSP